VLQVNYEEFVKMMMAKVRGRRLEVALLAQRLLR